MAQENKAVARLLETFGDRGLTHEKGGAGPIVRVSPRLLREVLQFLKSDGTCAFDMLTDLFGVDCFHRKPRFDVVYLLNALSMKQRLTVKIGLDDNETLETASDIWKAAEWFEREIFDMFGIRFGNHPDLRRILLDDDFDGHPLRKDFPLEGRDGDTPFVVRLDEEKG